MKAKEQTAYILIMALALMSLGFLMYIGGIMLYYMFIDVTYGMRFMSEIVSLGVYWGFGLISLIIVGAILNLIAINTNKKER